jgi:hypothetical protein
MYAECTIYWDGMRVESDQKSCNNGFNGYSINYEEWPDICSSNFLVPQFVLGEMG